MRNHTRDLFREEVPFGQHMPIFISIENLKLESYHNALIVERKTPAFIVEPANSDGCVVTKDGIFKYAKGDPLMRTDTDDYIPLPPGYLRRCHTVAGKPFMYARRGEKGLAIKLGEDTCVVLKDGSMINGKEGDWLIRGNKGTVRVADAVSFGDEYYVLGKVGRNLKKHLRT